MGLQRAVVGQGVVEEAIGTWRKAPGALCFFRSSSKASAAARAAVSARFFARASTSASWTFERSAASIASSPPDTARTADADSCACAASRAS